MSQGRDDRTASPYCKEEEGHEMEDFVAVVFAVRYCDWCESCVTCQQAQYRERSWEAVSTRRCSAIALATDQQKASVSAWLRAAAESSYSKGRMPLRLCPKSLVLQR